MTGFFDKTMKKFFSKSTMKNSTPEQNHTSDLEHKPNPESQKQVQNKAGNLLVGAIDFGTTYSGWAFSFLQDYKSNPTKASVKVWHSGGSGTLVTEKAPTCVLIEPDGKTLVAFGYDAENRYRELTDADEHRDYYYFRRFKMMLYKKLGERIDRSITLEDEMGRSLPALDVFAIVIHYLINDMIEDVNTRLSGIIRETDIHWVLTVPAIWTDVAKQFMRESAIKAGINCTRLEIALEPEAASIYCRHLSVETTVRGHGMSVAQFQPGTRYLILDAGGGTIDTTIHEVEENGIKEVHAATGGSWGGTMVDRAFEAMLLRIFSREVYQQFKKENTDDWLDLLRDFEVKKREVKPNGTGRINMKFPLSLIDKYQSVTGNHISRATSSVEGGIELIGDKMKFSVETFRSFFTASNQKIIAHVKDIMKDCNVKAILMVGGFSDSPILQHVVRTAFPDKDVIIPIGASSTVLRGALIYGHSPSFITERVLKYTYGVEICVPFINGRHPENKRISHDGKFQCKGIFDKLVEKDQAVPVGKAQTVRSYNPTAAYQSVIPFRIFASDLPDPQYIDKNASFVGELTVEITDPDDDLHREILICLTFSGTEIYVEAEDRKAGRNFTTSINFLG